MSSKKANKNITNHNAGLVPKLRFPEFRNEWEIYRIGDIGKLINGLNGKNRSDFGTGSPFITYKQVFDSSKIDFSECGRVRIHKDENQNTIEYGDILFTTSSETPEEVGFSSVVLDEPKEPTYLNSFCFAIRTHKDFQIRPDFSRFLFHSTLYRKSVVRIAQGSTRYNISKSTFQEIKIPLPSLPEQQKIAACLSSLDELITAEGQKLELLNEHKKGLLQNLFPQEGEKVPRLRFKEFEKDGEWVEKRLDELALFLKGKGISKADIDENGTLPCIRYGELYTHYGEVIMKVNSYTNRSEEDLILSEINDVIIPSSGETKEDIATASCIKISGVAIGGDLNILRSTLNGEFLAYYLSHGLKSSISKIAQGDAVVHLYATQLKKLLIKVPLSKEKQQINNQEQQKIASTLSSLDELIQAQAQRIETLQAHKKGLLQGLFPEMVI